MDRPYFRENIIASMKSTYFSLCPPELSHKDRMPILITLVALGLNFDIKADEIFRMDDVERIRSHYGRG